MTLRSIILWPAISIGLTVGPRSTGAEAPVQGTTPVRTHAWDAAVASKATAIFQQLPHPAVHDAGLGEAEANRRLRADAAYERLVGEELRGKWFAALVSAARGEPFAIRRRFRTWRELQEFLAARNALVEVWAPGEAGHHRARRIPATELAALNHQRYDRPTFVTVTYPDPATGKAVSFRLEFGFGAAASLLDANEAYRKHRQLLLRSQQILGATNGKGLPDATAQWERLRAEVEAGHFPIREIPTQPKDAKDVFLAFEFQTDNQNNFVRPIRVYRESEIQTRIVGQAQVLFLQPDGRGRAREVWGFRRTGFRLQPLPNPILGEDVVELRVKDPTQPDPNRWHALEFGEPELVKQSALAHFALLSAYLERHRKERAVTQSKLALVAEPIVAALNVGGDLAGLGFPAGEPARLLYNLVTWRLINPVPTTKQMRELFAVMAARHNHPQIRPERFLSRKDIAALKKEGRKLTDRQVQAYLEQMDDADVRAMLRLARMGMFDARVTTFLNTLTSAFKLSGVSDEAGPIRDLFNNVRFSMNGDINLSTLLMLALGQKVATPLSGTSLETLSHGRGPQEAWLQYLTVSVDIRAVINTLVRLTKRTLAKKELEKPFPYAPRMSDLAAYEVRIFGFPLLLFYKRGLVKADYEAYEHDYAYGLRGVRVVEHFPTRQDMEAEIRAGRMFPLGLVRAPSITGRLKETHLVVYAHRVAKRKYRGKTTLIIYGLKAYQENSELMAREILRFRAYEKGLRDGAVIEQRIWESADRSASALAFEPVIHPGSNAVRQIYDPLLGNLLELRRCRLRQRWGLPGNPARLAQIHGALAALGVRVAEGDPLVEIDPYQSSFVYRRKRKEQVDLIRVTVIPSLKEIDRELRKAEEARIIANLRREAAANKNAGVVLLNEVRRRSGHLEPGPLRHNPSGGVLGAGVLSGKKAMEKVFDLINRLPVTDRARLLANHFAATVVDLEGVGRVFLTIEFPLGTVTNEWTNPLTGQREIVLYQNGFWRRTITDRRIVEVDYDAKGIETDSRTYWNRGTRRAPVRGALLEETRTVDYWRHDLTRPGVDPYRPVISKIRVDYVTGRMARETYGLFTLPVEVDDDLYVTRSRYTPYGILESADVFDNGRDQSEFERPMLTRLLHPIPGQARFHLVSLLPRLETQRELSSAHYRTVVQATDLVTGLTRTETFDNGRFGRKLMETYSDPFDGTRSFSSAVTWAYRDDFYAGLVPVRAIQSAMPSGARLSVTVTTSYDPLRRRLVGTETAYTGRTQTNTWSYRWRDPIVIETAQRRITQEFNRDETVVRSRTRLEGTGETAGQTTGRFDPLAKTWQVSRRLWYRPRVLDHDERSVYSAFGRLIRTRVGTAWEIRPTYASDGTEESRRTFQTNAVTGRFDILCRLENDYRWRDGERDARVRLYAGGAAIDDFRERTDTEGRVVAAGIRKWPPLELRTVRTYDGASDRVLRAQVFQNGKVRTTYETLGLIRRPGGAWWLRVRAAPFWGLLSTNTYLLGDPLGRVLLSESEDGRRTRVTAWLGATAIARSSEVEDRHGRLKERFLRRPDAGLDDGVPYDLIQRYRIGPWRNTALVEEQGVAQGTDTLLFIDRADERIHLDLSEPYPAPRYATDPRGRFGLQVDLHGTIRPNVTALFASRTRLPQEPPGPDPSPDRVLEVSAVDLRGFFSYPCSKRIFDRAGILLEESTGTIKSLGARPASEQTLRTDLGQAIYLEKTTYDYQRGWMQPTRDPKTGQTMIAFTQQPPTNSAAWSVNDSGWRERATLATTYRSPARTAPGTNPVAYLARRLDSPRLLKENRYLPGVTNVWVAWSGAELGPRGAELFATENIFDAQGELSTMIAHKRDSRGRPASKIVYRLPRPRADAWRICVPQLTTNGSALNLSGPADLSACDFVAFVLEPAPATVAARFRDVFGHAALVGIGNWPGKQYSFAFWPIARAQAQWLPDESLPRRGATVTASRSQIARRNLFVVSIPELAKAGLAVGRLTSVQLILPKATPAGLRATALYRLEPGEPVRGFVTAQDYAYDFQMHLGNLGFYRRRKTSLTSRQAKTGRGWDSVLAYEGLAVGSLAPRPQPPYYPALVLTDNSDPDSPRPLYALAAEDGRFLEYYQRVRAGDTRVYTVVNGFETPKMEIFRAGILDDEIAAGILAFGQGYYVTVPLAKAGRGLAATLAGLHNRCVASAFALGMDSLFGPVAQAGESLAEPTQRIWQQTPALFQAHTIDQMPTLAEALLPTRPAPWDSATGNTPLLLSPARSTNAAARALLRLINTYCRTNVLVPTSPGSVVERYVDTVQEAAIIELAVRLNEIGTAKSLLAFYWDKSQGGTNLLHSTYDSWTGASLGKQIGYRRASEAPVTADAQLAIAQAAFSLGTATRQIDALDFGRNLLHSVLADFRYPASAARWPRGIAAQPVQSLTRRHGLTFWPRANAFSVGSNARAFLLLRRLEAHRDRYPFGRRWQQTIVAAEQEEAAWLTNRIAPYARARGVVPKGLFEIQDVHNQTTALAMDRWTTTDDWLSFLEAADAMGITQDLTRAWLDNLARAHGVVVKGVWGLDWGVSLLRPDAVSTRLTAKFQRVAELLGERQAADFAGRNLDRLHQGTRWPVLLTSAAPDAPLPTGQGDAVYPATPTNRNRSAEHAIPWPETLGVYVEALGNSPRPTDLPVGSPMQVHPSPVRDITQFFWTAGGFYLLLVVTALFWWVLSYARRRRRARPPAGRVSAPLVSNPVMQRAEERWAERVLGVQMAPGAERSRYSNGAIEQNFHMQLRAIYKLALEWRRGVNGWSEDDPRIAEDAEDEWLNGLDEFAAMAGLYTRWVIKAGRKDGLRKPDVLRENEDSNHIWARWVSYFSESHLRLLRLLKDFKANPAAAAVFGINDQIELVLRTLGLRKRQAPFDGRALFDAPAGASAFDLLLLQLPGARLSDIVEELERKLDIPREHMVSFIKGYKSFKAREELYPIHPYVLEAAKVLPHFLLMGLVGLIWYNSAQGGLPIFPYLKNSLTAMALDWTHSLVWGLPLVTGAALSVIAHFLRIYRFRWGAGAPAGPAMALDAEVSRLFGRSAEAATPALRTGPWWDPGGYRRIGWIFRAVGLGLLAVALFQLEAPSFATFMFVKVMLGMLLLTESASLLLPLMVSPLSRWLEDYVSANPGTWRPVRFLNQLNILPTRPASLIWLSLKYHLQPSVPSGGALPALQAIGSYLVLAAAFFFVGSYLFKQALEVWFRQAYQSGWNLELVLGMLLFLNTMYLLRFGLFVLLAAYASAAAVYPVKLFWATAATVCFGLQFANDAFSRYVDLHFVPAMAVALVAVVSMSFEPEWLAWLANRRWCRRRRARRRVAQRAALAQLRRDPERALGVVYMSGDDLSFQKLTPELLMTRVKVLRDQLGSSGIQVVLKMQSVPDDPALFQSFKTLYELEQQHGVTLWHPLQLVVTGRRPSLRPELGLNLAVPDDRQREQLLASWHLRRWLVTMMSTAGHAQDTAINLADLAVALTRERLAANTVFYLIQNKYDDHDNNRPSQLAYDQGELGQRNKLARLLMELAPGSRAYNLNDWTPFGFKAGGLVGMDLVYEESLKLINMLILDRNANANDLQAAMTDLKLALSDPGVVIVIPGRGTTNTLTPVGQGSQLIEEGHRALTRGVLMLGGTGAETLGTGWGNIQAVYYARVQRALCDPDTPKMPLTTPSQRGAAFGDRCEGLIGFGPHAIGISEDIWGVTQAAHNALALGYPIKCRRSQAFWHKIRESWSHAEWLSAFPRWSGGYLQMMFDPLMQQINDAGPLSVFAKELRASGGRFFLSAPFALLSILLMPLAIMWDVSPFVQILILLWNLGLLMNQVLTALGLVACLESTGFSRVTALAGALGAVWVAGSISGCTPFAPPLGLLGFLAGGFALGLGRWLYYRGRDIILFGPQLVIHGLGQMVRQSLEFVLSGASANDAKAVNMAFRAWVGPREDRPFEGYQNPVNLRTVVWGVGLLALCLNLFALAHLDFLNVLLLLPSLMFSVSAVIGPFLTRPRPGDDLGGLVWAPKLLGWLASGAFYMLVARLIALGGAYEQLGVCLCLLCFGSVLAAAMKYAGYSRQLRRLTARLARLMAQGGLAENEARKLADRIVRNLGGDVAKTRAALQATSLTEENQTAAAMLVEERLSPLLKRPVADLRVRAPGNPRFVSELSRSFVLGLFTFIWFFVVPVPGLLVFTAPGGYRIAFSLAGILAFAAAAVGGVLAGGCLSLFLEEWERHRLGENGLVARIERQYRAFQSLMARETLGAWETSRLHGLFTDLQTYVDQRSYAYARRTLGTITQRLKAAASPPATAGSALSPTP